VVGGVRAGRQRMRARIRRFVDPLLVELVADVLVDEHEWIAVDDGRHAAAVNVGMLRLRGELGDALGLVCGVEHLRHAEIEIAARLLFEELLLEIGDARIGEGESDGL
jgi:hypothetical protein